MHFVRVCSHKFDGSSRSLTCASFWHFIVTLTVKWSRCEWLEHHSGVAGRWWWCWNYSQVLMTAIQAWWNALLTVIRTAVCMVLKQDIIRARKVWRCGVGSAWWLLTVQIWKRKQEAHSTSCIIDMIETSQKESSTMIFTSIIYINKVWFTIII